MRYAWDDRFEMPDIRTLPAAGPRRSASYEAHIAPIVKRYCVSCHRAGKDNNDYLMTSYEEILTTGENAEFNIIPGEEYERSYLLQTIQETNHPGRKRRRDHRRDAAQIRPQSGRGQRLPTVDTRTACPRLPKMRLCFRRYRKRQKRRKQKNTDQKRPSISQMAFFDLPGCKVG